MKRIRNNNIGNFILVNILFERLYCPNACHHQLYIYIFTNPSVRPGHDTRSIFKRSLTGLNSEFSFSWTSCLSKVEEPSLSYYLPIAGGRIIAFIPFPKILVLCEMQTASSRIWTRVAVSISYDDNHYTTDTSIICYKLLKPCYKVLLIYFNDNIYLPIYLLLRG